MVSGYVSDLMMNYTFKNNEVYDFEKLLQKTVIDNEFQPNAHSSSVCSLHLIYFQRIYAANLN
jgi:hypothetical protein